jgi:hypothetical protein
MSTTTPATPATPIPHPMLTLLIREGEYDLFALLRDFLLIEMLKTRVQVVKDSLEIYVSQNQTF